VEEGENGKDSGEEVNEKGLRVEVGLKEPVTRIARVAQGRQAGRPSLHRRKRSFQGETRCESM